MGVLDGKAALIIGGGRGVGRATALAYAREGARVVVNDTGAARDGTGTDPSVADSVVREIRDAGGEAQASAVDASTEDGAKRAVEETVAHFGKLDTLVYAAGTLGDQTLLRADAATFRRVVDTHLSGAFFATRAAATAMFRSGGGRIVLSTSSAGLLGNFGQPAYSAAAGGVYGLLRSASIELQRHQVFVNGVAPIAKTRLTEDLPMFEHVNTMTPEHAAPAYVFLGSELAGDATGNVLSIAGGRLSAFKLVESSGRFKETEDGVWTAAEIAEQWSVMGRP
jgi:NAD(P)-dependent dehydrogenase (short-subunit alcohol dehydrogenase family)